MDDLKSNENIDMEILSFEEKSFPTQNTHRDEIISVTNEKADQHLVLRNINLNNPVVLLKAFVFDVCCLRKLDWSVEDLKYIIEANEIKAKTPSQFRIWFSHGIANFYIAKDFEIVKILFKIYCENITCDQNPDTKTFSKCIVQIMDKVIQQSKRSLLSFKTFCEMAAEKSCDFNFKKSNESEIYRYDLTRNLPWFFDCLLSMLPKTFVYNDNVVTFWHNFESCFLSDVAEFWHQWCDSIKINHFKNKYPKNIAICGPKNSGKSSFAVHCFGMQVKASPIHDTKCFHRELIQDDIYMIDCSAHNYEEHDIEIDFAIELFAGVVVINQLHFEFETVKFCQLLRNWNMPNILLLAHADQMFRMMQNDSEDKKMEIWNFLDSATGNDQHVQTVLAFKSELFRRLNTNGKQHKSLAGAAVCLNIYELKVLSKLYPQLFCNYEKQKETMFNVADVATKILGPKSVRKLVLSYFGVDDEK